MNFIRHFNGWMDVYIDDKRLKPHHITLYLALFRSWNMNHFRNPISIKRSEIMRIAKIGSVTTYQRTIRQLSEWGYIQYEPSFDPMQGAQVNLYSFSQGRSRGSGQGSGQSSGQSDSQSTGQASSQAGDTIYINNTNSINTKNKINAYGTSIENSDFGNAGESPDADPQAAGTGNNHREKETPGGRGPGRGFDIPASIEEAQAYFLQEHSTAAEAQKFVNHYQSNGWLIGGRSPMKDWRASARNWIDNAKKFSNDKPSHPKPGKLDTGPKNYAEPL